MLEKHFLEVALSVLLSFMPTALKRSKSNIVIFVFLLPITAFEVFQPVSLLFRIERFVAIPNPPLLLFTVLPNVLFPRESAQLELIVFLP